VDSLQYLSKDLLILTKWPLLAQSLVFTFLFLWMMLFGAHASTEFIYFQF
jgi:hypothetical protein